MLREGRWVRGVGQDPGGRRERRHRPVAEHVPWADRQPRRAGPADHLHREDAVAAEGEEVVVDADARQAQHPGDQLGQQRLARAGWRGVGDQPGEVRSRQRATVELAVGGDRQRVEHDEGRRDHVLGQRLDRPGPHGVDVHTARAGTVRVGAGRVRSSHAVRCIRCVRYQVGHQVALPEVVLADDDHRAGDPRGLGQHRLDLAELDPETSDLHLVVDPAEEGELTVVGPPDQVAGAVQPAARRPERVGDEPLRGQARPAQIAASELDAGEVELSGDARRHRAHGGVERVHLGVPHRTADRHRTGR